MSDPHVSSAAPLNLIPLAPNYSEENHGTYLEALERALDEHPRTVRNIALAGSYGVGKSSILNELTRRREDRVISVSLLTLGLEPEVPPPGQQTNPAAATTSNRIQKEVVKQLLYRQSPSKTTLSRFRRIDRPHLGRELIVAGAASVVLVTLLSVSGALERIGKVLALDMPATSGPIQYAGAIFLAVAVVGLAVFLARAVSRGRIGVQKVAAGPATIELSPRSTSYFDEYLDEIVYFFEMNSKSDILVIEDLDRFNDPAIYESLRSLNSILNASQQLGKRDIRFIYAVRDSIFEKLGRQDEDPDLDDTRAELGRANRTKFFELIIPVVPFITHKNAREVMHRVLEERGHGVDRNLIDVAARHLPDMRTIYNVVNEFEVFKRRLLDVATPVPGLSVERLFAMVLYKNTQAADFEAVRRSDSSLDRLYNLWRDLVAQNIDLLRADNDRLHLRLRNGAAADEHAARLGGQLQRVVTAFAGLHNTGLVRTGIYDEKRELSDETLATAKLWRAVREGGTVLSLRTAEYGRVVITPLAPPAIEDLTGLKLHDAAFLESSGSADRATIQRNTSQLAFLQRRHTWLEILDRTSFLYEESGGTRKTFRQWAEALLPSELVFELVANGFIDSYFPLHVSTFYGKLLPPDAMTFIMRNVDRATADPDFPLSVEDVDAIISDQGPTVIANRSMRNVSIVDRLLSTDRDAAETIIRLAAEDALGVALFNRYLERGESRADFVALLAPYWGQIFSYLVQDAPLSNVDRQLLVSIAMTHSDRVAHDYEYGYGLREFLEENATELPALRDARSRADAVSAITVVVGAGAVLPRVDGMPPDVGVALQATRNYALTAPNLSAVSGGSALALDALKSTAPGVYDYAISDSSAYLAAIDEAESDESTAESAGGLVEVLSDLGHWSSTAIDGFVGRTRESCIVDLLADVPSKAWPALVAHRRTPATFLNVHAYVQDQEQVDETLGSLLTEVIDLDGAGDASAEDRAFVALAVINSSSDVLSTADRLRLASSMQPGTLPTTAVQPRPGDLIGELVRAELLVDDADLFEERLMVDWPTQEHTLLASTRFIEVISPGTLQTRFVAPLLESEDVPPSIQAQVAKSLDDWELLPWAAFDATAECALRGRITLGALGIARMQQGGVSANRIVRLLAQENDFLGDDDVRDILRTLKGDYAVIADPGRQRPKFPDTEAVRVVLRRLEEADVVSGFTKEQDGRLRVNLRRN